MRARPGRPPCAAASRPQRPARRAQARRRASARGGASRAPRRDRRLQRGRRERRRGGAPPALLADVQERQHGEREQREQDERGAKLMEWTRRGAFPSVACRSRRAAALHLAPRPLRPGWLSADRLRDVGGLAHVLAVDARDDVALPDAGAVGGAAGDHALHLCAALARGRRRRRLESEVGTLDLSRRARGPAPPAARCSTGPRSRCRRCPGSRRSRSASSRRSRARGRRAAGRPSCRG